MMVNFVKRFPDGFKTKAPYNVLCLLNSNNDIFFDSEDQTKEAINVIKSVRKCSQSSQPASTAAAA